MQVLKSFKGFLLIHCTDWLCTYCNVDVCCAMSCLRWKYFRCQMWQSGWFSKIRSQFLNSSRGNMKQTRPFHSCEWAGTSKLAVMPSLMKTPYWFPTFSHICDRILENHPYRRILHIKYLALKSSFKVLLSVYLWFQCSKNALNYKKKFLKMFVMSAKLW